ncbi:MAG: hypothetical protein HS111_32180 [Kofleriaceae bacterium]|nr:hypothetical protein [Kofleriaceae bacterium]
MKQVEAIRDAVNGLNLQIEIVISPTTKVGRESRSKQQRSVLRELRNEIMAATKGKDVAGCGSIATA